MSKPENITVEITGMSCASCAQRIESLLLIPKEWMNQSSTLPQGKPQSLAASPPKRSIKLLKKEDPEHNCTHI
ncbi:MAG: hypothetical protein GY777_00640 [Candidatus Brocadiaceae bacterium]|nr:hypothetical protein [Candidatus Brocadiaceae bacterium]